VSMCVYAYVHISLFLPECACTTIIDTSLWIFSLMYCCCVSIIFVNCICPTGALIWLINLYYTISGSQYHWWRKQEYPEKTCKIKVLRLGVWCLMPLSTVFQLYRAVSIIGGGNRSTRRKPVKLKKHKPVYHCSVSIAHKLSLK
jgi:hypothetical protein